MTTARDIPKEKLVQLADKHIALYTGRAEAGRAGMPGIRIGECEGYLELWLGTKRKLVDGEALEPDELEEIQDAIECGDYDELLGL